MVVTEQDPIVVEPGHCQEARSRLASPPAFPGSAILAGLGFALATAFLAAAWREFVAREEWSYSEFFYSGSIMALLMGSVVRSLGGRGRFAIHFVLWAGLGAALVGTLVGGYWDYVYGCSWAGPADTLIEAIERRLDGYALCWSFGLVLTAIVALVAPVFYGIWQDRRLGAHD